VGGGGVTVPRGKPLTPKQAGAIKRVWLETASFAETARRVGVSESSVRKYLGKKGKPVCEPQPDAAALYARELDKNERDHLATVSKARQRIDSALDVVADTKELVGLAAQAHDGLRAITTTKMAHAKLSGALVEKHDVTSGGAALKLYLPAES
jgi:transposase